MQRHELVHEIHCPSARMWELFFDDKFNVQMYCEGLRFPKCETVEKIERGGVLHRRMVMTPKVEVPKPLAKVFGDRIGFEEIGDWERSADPGKAVYRWQIILAALGDKVRITGTMRLIDIAEGHCSRRTEFEVESKVFGIGGMLEKTSADNVIAGWNGSAKWINSWLAEQTTAG
ncbi:DUF2505 family protein [Nannocystaceae bacterium ST9]